MRKFKETQKRSIIKTVTIRVLFSLSHLVNGFIVSGSWVIGAQILGIAAVVNMLLHWGHERAWDWVQWNRKPGNNSMFQDGQPRTISKSITWRILITINNFLIPYITTGSWQTAVAFLTIATVMNVVIYYVHERVWNKINWGKIAL